jgi:transcriptional regulator with XRE-family HTH domain
MKLQYPKAWFERSAEIEGNAEVGAGIPPDAPTSTELHAQDITALDTRIAFGQFVSLWRRNHGWNAERLASEAGIDTAEVLEIEHDPHCEPEPDAIFKLAGVFRVPPHKLMEIAGIVESRTPRMREQHVRYAGRPEFVAAITETEKLALESVLAALRSESSSPK